MIHPKLKSIDSTAFDLSTYVPPSENFSLCLDLSIGPVNSDGADLFYVTVCSPQYVEQLVAQEGIATMRGYLVTDGFQVTVIRARIEKLLSAVSGETWAEVATKLSRYFKWEFDDYVETIHSED